MAEAVLTSMTEPPRRRRALASAAAMAAGLALAGCSTTGAGGPAADSGGSILGKIFPRFDESLANGMVRPEGATPARFLERYLNPAKTPHASDGKEPKSLSLSNEGWTPIKEAANPEADKELEAATALYRQGKYDQAEPLFVQIAKKRKGSSWGEKAQYLLAESYYEEGKYYYANDAYEQLVKDYPGNDYKEKVAGREFEIAQKWFDYAPDPKKKPAEKFPWLARFQGKVPLVDSEGHAIKALEQARNHDPSGPVSDDACLKLADHYFAVKDYETAAMYYDQLVTDHPKSELVRRAQLSSIDAKLKGYLGPDFDGKGLESARDTIKQTQAMYPEHDAENERLYHLRALIDDQFAERAYRVGVFYLNYYKKTGYGAASAEHYFGLVNARWPRSEWAKKSKAELVILAKAPRKEALPSKIMAQPNVDPWAGGSGGGGGGMNGGGMGGGMGGMGGGGMGGGGMGMPG